jgi:hypothetical protein
MRERGILFSGPMVQAILEDRKMQTRRVIKPQPQCGSDAEHCPYGVPGDRLWLREKWRYYEHPELMDCIEYAADSAVIKPTDLDNNTGFHFSAMCDAEGTTGKWRPSIFMPRWASRITLEIVEVRVQRIAEISAQDCIDEGIDPSEVPGIGSDSSFIKAYHELWDAINAKRGYSFSSNPWCWCITFKRVKP